MFQAFWASFLQIIIPYSGLLLIIGTGVLATRWHILTSERIDMLSEIVLLLILPIFTFYNAATGSLIAVLNQAPFMVGLGLGGALAGYGLATILAHVKRWDWEQRSVCQVSGVCGNTGYLGIPICTALFGSAGAILAILYDLGASIYLLTLGIGVFQKENRTQISRRGQVTSILKRFVNPIIISLFIGIGFSLAGIQLPTFIQVPLKDLSNLAIPVMLLVLGGLIYNAFQAKEVDNRSAVLLGFLKLIVMPALIWIVVSYLPLSSTARGVAIVEAAMPSAVTAVTFATRYKADDKLASSTTILTTMVSVLTIPIFAAAVMNSR